MNASEPNPLDLARKGDLRVIASLIQKVLPGKAQVTQTLLKDACLYIVIGADQTPDENLANLVHDQIAGLQIVGVRDLNVYGHRIGDKSSLWTKHFPVHLSSHGYQILQELSQTSTGRSTYLVQTLEANEKSRKKYLVQYFELPHQRQGLSLDESFSYESLFNTELQLLKSLNCPGIPKFVKEIIEPRKSKITEPGEEVFEISGAKLIVTEIGDIDQFELRSLEEWKSLGKRFQKRENIEIVKAVLQILVYLQKDIQPPVQHHDIKPANILVGLRRNEEEGPENDNLRVYLIGFSPKPTPMSLAISPSVFIPPEQMRSKPILHLSSDLYSLGITILCLVSSINPDDIEELRDATNHINWPAVKEIVSSEQVDLAIMDWVKLLLEPDPLHRFSNANEAFDDLNLSIQLGNFENSQIAKKVVVLALTALLFYPTAYVSFWIGNGVFNSSVTFSKKISDMWPPRTKQVTW